MHIPDGFLSAGVAASTTVLAAGGIATSLRAVRRDPEPMPAGMLGSIAAFLFAAQMVNVPVAPGTSGHLVGVTLAAVLVGPWQACLIMAVVLGVQAVLFQDGGITAYGANLIDMGVGGGLVGYTVAALLAKLFKGPRGYAVGAVGGAFAATLAGATLTAIWLALSGLYPLRGILPILLVTHAAIGVLEAALTGGILITVLRWRPDLVRGIDQSPGSTHVGAVAVGVLGLALVVAAFVAPFASALPDGLEWTAQHLGFAGRAGALWHAPMPDYHIPAWLGPLASMSSVIAGLVGTLATALVAWVIGRRLTTGHDAPHR
jgi:cobalt/nickel transport system permease protein